MYPERDRGFSLDETESSKNADHRSRGISMPELVPLPGSDRRAVPNVQPAGDLDPNAPVSVTLMLRRRAEVPSELVTGPQTLSADELAARYGADPADVELVTSTLEGL